jgi:integrase|tara:strand:- start:398 stop:1675 length:1278 start_codon:yes stop_codon:yes gene_type:complete
MYCLQLRKTTYQFVRRVPVDLLQHYHKTLIRHSLNTKDFREAKRLRNAYMVRYDVEFEQLRPMSLEFEQSCLKSSDINKLFLSNPKTPISPPSVGRPLGLTIKALSDFYLTKLSLSGKKKTIQDFSSTIDVALEYFANDTLANNISRDSARDFMMFVSKLPVRFALVKETRHRPLRDVIKIADKMGLKRSSVPTVNKRIDVIRAVFAYGLEEQKVGNNPFVNMSMKDPKKAKGKRNPMSSNDIGKLFAGLREGSEDYWTVMIALYQGARQNEILQLRKSDILFERGSWLLSFHDRYENNSMKTESSVRTVPIHKELIERGLIKWITDIRPESRLFPSAVLGIYGNYSQAYSKHINSEFGRFGVTNHFHSLRHSFRDACREAEISQDIADYLGGWSGAASVGRSYGALEFSLKHLSKALNRIKYPI